LNKAGRIGLAGWSNGRIFADMAQKHPADELAEFRDLLARLESGELTLRQGGKDVGEREIAILKREIAAVEKTLERLKGQQGE
jgi:hypothetical protein